MFLDSCRQLEMEGFDVTYLRVLSNGIIYLDVLKETIREDVLIASAIFVNK